METNYIFGILGANFGGIGIYVYIFPLMNDKDNIRHNIVARQVWVTIATKTFPGHVSDCYPFQN